MPSGNIVKLDIGGTVFKTSRSTLTKFDGFFKIMLESDIPLEKDDAGCIFIDRSPKHFERILNFMRDGDIILPKSEEDILEIQKEAQYYQLNGLMELCNSKISNMLRVIESDEQMLQIVATSKDKPVVIIFYYIGHNALEDPPNFNFEKFLEEFKNKFDIYFRPLHNSVSVHSKFRIHDSGSTHSGPLSQFRGYVERIYKTNRPDESDYPPEDFFSDEDL